MPARTELRPPVVDVAAHVALCIMIALARRPVNPAPTNDTVGLITAIKANRRVSFQRNFRQTAEDVPLATSANAAVRRWPSSMASSGSK